jgi:hypothetical protein
MKKKDPQGTAPAINLLVKDHNIVEVAPTLSIESHPIRCNSWYCIKNCGWQKKKKLREQVGYVFKKMQSPFMFTLTVDPKLFSHDPVRAHEHILRVRALSNLMRKLNTYHSGRWIVLFECHKNEMPHFHVLIDCQWLPKDVIQRAWDKFQPINEKGSRGRTLGRVRFIPPKKWDSVEKAINYLIKDPKYDWPRWVLTYPHYLRRYHASQGFFRSIRPARTTSTVPKDKLLQTKRKRRTAAERHAGCCKDLRFLRVWKTLDPITRRYVVVRTEFDHVEPNPAKTGTGSDDAEEKGGTGHPPVQPAGKMRKV